MIQVQALDALVADLEALLSRGERGKPVVSLLEAYAAEHRDWCNFAFFKEDEYTRNLVAKNEHFELLILCWGAHQISPIHNHEGQCCWMTVLEGSVTEAHYVRPEQVKPGPLEALKSRTYHAGQVAYINDDIALHVVSSAGGAPAVSIHLYAKAFDQCNVYCPETGKITRKRLSNHSERGKLL